MAYGYDSFINMYECIGYLVHIFVSMNCAKIIEKVFVLSIFDSNIHEI